MSPPCHCPRRVPYTEGRYRGGGSPPLRIVYRRRFKKGMTFYRAARSISRGMEGVRLFFSRLPAADVRNDLVPTLSGASTENTRAQIPFAPSSSQIQISTFHVDIDTCHTRVNRKELLVVTLT